MKVDLSKLSSPVLLAGDERTGYRDPAAWFQDGVFYMYFTISTIGADGLVYLQTAWSKTADLVSWTAPQCLTEPDRRWNWSSPGNIVRDGDEFFLCLQSYPTPRPEDKYGNEDARIWTMRSGDLEQWYEPTLLDVEGPDRPLAARSRIIDPYLLRDKTPAGPWWCFYKKAGMICYSWSADLQNWQAVGTAARGENPCVIVDGDDYVLFYAPENGIGVQRSQDMARWRDSGRLMLGAEQWPWAQGRLTAGFVLDLRAEPRVGKALLFFHGSRWPEDDPRGGWANWINLGLAWSDDLRHWRWPG